MTSLPNNKPLQCWPTSEPPELADYVHVYRGHQQSLLCTVGGRDAHLAALQQLETAAIRPVARPDGSIRLCRRVESLLTPDLPRPNAGLEWIVRYLFVRDGKKLVPPQQVVAPDPQQTSLQGRLPTDPHVLRFVQEHSHGQIWYAPGVQPALLIAQVAMAWPNAKVAVVVAKRRSLRPVAEGLRRLGIPISLLSPKHHPEYPARVVLGTFYDMGHNAIGFAQRDIVIVLHGPDALCHDAQVALMSVESRFRLFGLFPYACRLSLQERDWLVAAFSLDAMSVPRHGYQQVLPRVAWLPHVTAGSTEISEPWQVKQKLIWESHIRNRRTAQIAKALANGKQAEIARLCPLAATYLEGHQPQTVVVLVDGLDHALALAQRLPDWPIVTVANPNEHGLSAKQRRLLADRQLSWTLPAGIIATVAGAERLNNMPDGLLVVVWAGGGPHLPGVPANWLVCPLSSQRRMLLIDIDDQGHGLLQRWSRRRQKAYRRADWFAPNQVAKRQRIEMFLAARPRRRAR